MAGKGQMSRLVALASEKGLSSDEASQAAADLFKVADLNKDGSISMQEWDAAFTEIDEDKDDSISRKEWARLQGNAVFFDLCTRKNLAAITRAEWTAAFETLALKDPKKDDGSDEESDEDDDVIDDAELERRAPARGPRQSVSAEAYGEWNKKRAFTPPVYEKSDDQKDRLKRTLVKSFMFSPLETSEFNIILMAMQELTVDKDEVLIKKGDDGDKLFVIETGVFDCSIPIEEKWTVVKTCHAGDVFGELALLYNAPRAATVTATEKSTCWSLDRDTFNHIVKEAAQNKRDRYDAFLAKVPLLDKMDPYERSQLADALQVESFGDQSTVMSQGEIGDKFYIVEEGSAAAKKDGAEVMQYSVGDYFGELALIRNAPRAATVVTKGPAKLLSINSVTFKRLLNIDEIQKRAAELYK